MKPTILIATIWVGALIGAVSIAIAQSGCQTGDDRTDCALDDHYLPSGSSRPSGGGGGGGGGSQTPRPSYIDIGNQHGRACWFNSSSPTSLRIHFRSGNLAAVYFDPYGYGPGGPGVIRVNVGFLPACIWLSTSTTTSTIAPQVLARRVTASFVHQRPSPTFSPRVPNGLVGLETRMSVAVPSAFGDTLRTGSRTLEVEGKVRRVGISWGDGSASNLTGVLNKAGRSVMLRHTYSQKTCNPPGRRDRCHPSRSAYPVRVWFEWQVRWRLNGSSGWNYLSADNTEKLTNYPVREVIGSLTG